MTKLTFEDIKLLFVSHHKHHQLYSDKHMIPGFYNWPKVFYTQNNFVNYDDHIQFRRLLDGGYNVILFGLSRPENFSFLPVKMQTVKNTHIGTEMLKDSGITKENMQEYNEAIKKVKDEYNIKIVGHIDYSPSMWKHIDAFSLEALKMNLNALDYVFAADPFIANMVIEITGHKKDVFLFPHPTMTNSIKDLTYKHKTKSNIVRNFIHRYNNEWLIPHIVTQQIRNANYETETPFQNITTCLDGNEGFLTHLRSMGVQYPERGKIHSEWLKTLADTYAIVDSYHEFTNYGRTCTEAACCRTPLVGSSHTYLQNKIFPRITSKPFNIYHQAELVDRLVRDKKFYQEVVDFAYEEVEKVNYSATSEYFIKMLNNESEVLNVKSSEIIDEVIKKPIGSYKVFSKENNWTNSLTER